MRNLTKPLVFLSATALCLIAVEGSAVGSFDEALRLDTEDYTLMTVMVDGAPLKLRRYEATYVGNPVPMAKTQPARQMGRGGSPTSSEEQELVNPYAYQSLYVFVPEGASETAAMILNVNNGGWFASELSAGIEEGGVYVSNSDTDKVGAALAAGYIYVDIGTRGRGILSVNDTYPGHAPAAVVDTKAAIRWLRLNDDVLPGSAEKIVITGTSGGGGLSSVVAASGDSSDYLPYLMEIGAAGVRSETESVLSDSVFAAIVYCPITDLGHADLAYEWQYGQLRTEEDGLSVAALSVSKSLAEEYPAYLESLNLKLENGDPLTADTMPEAIEAEVRKSVEGYLASGGTVPKMGENFVLTINFMHQEKKVEVANDWLQVENGQITQFNLQNYLKFVAKVSPLKAVPAFDRSANSGNQGIDGENTLFGKANQSYSNFTTYGWNHNEVKGDMSGFDDTGLEWEEWIEDDGAYLADQLRLINPMAYLGGEAKTAAHWYIRHGMIDRDTSFAVEIALYAAVRGDDDVRDVNFALPWMTAHSGNYDVQEAYQWLAVALATSDGVDKG